MTGSLSTVCVFDPDPAKLEAWSTFAAAIFAAVAAVFAYRAYLKESRIEKRLRDSNEQAQASKVAAWIADHPIYINQDALLIRNASEVPIYNVKCSVKSAKGSVAIGKAAVVPPSIDGFPVDLPSLKLGSTASRRELPVGIEFTDASGIEWTRTFEGILYRRSSPTRGERSRLPWRR